MPVFCLNFDSYFNFPYLKMSNYIVTFILFPVLKFYNISTKGFEHNVERRAAFPRPVTSRCQRTAAPDLPPISPVQSVFVSRAAPDWPSMIPGCLDWSRLKPQSLSALLPKGLKMIFYHKNMLSKPQTSHLSDFLLANR